MQIDSDDGAPHPSSYRACPTKAYPPPSYGGHFPDPPYRLIRAIEERLYDDFKDDPDLHMVQKAADRIAQGMCVQAVCAINGNLDAAMDQMEFCGEHDLPMVPGISAIVRDLLSELRQDKYKRKNDYADNNMIRRIQYHIVKMLIYQLKDAATTRERSFLIRKASLAVMCRHLGVRLVSTLFPDHKQWEARRSQDDPFDCSKTPFYCADLNQLLTTLEGSEAVDPGVLASIRIELVGSIFPSVTEISSNAHQWFDGRTTFLAAAVTRYYEIIEKLPIKCGRALKKVGSKEVPEQLRNRFRELDVRANAIGGSSNLWKALRYDTDVWPGNLFIPSHSILKKAGRDYLIPAMALANLAPDTPQWTLKARGWDHEDVSYVLPADTDLQPPSRLLLEARGMTTADMDSWRLDFENWQRAFLSAWGTRHPD